MKLNLPLIAAVVAALAGVVGSTLVPLLGTQLAISIQAILQALSALLIAIPTYHVSSVAAAQSKLKAARFNAAGPAVEVHLRG